MDISSNQSQPLDRDLRFLIEQKAAQGDYENAIALMNVLLDKYPDSAVDFNNRGLMYFRNGCHQEAITDFNRALEINPRLDSAYNNRANCYAKTGNLAEALRDYDLALDYNPGNIRAWINEGITFREMGLYDLAIENFDLALTLSKRLKGRIYAERGRAYHLRGDWNLAIADYNRALKKLDNRDRERIELWLDELFFKHSA